MAPLYENDTSAYDKRDENYKSSEEEQEEREYYCEVCDREFSSEEYLQKHMGEHRVCGIDGCVFSAHSKLVEKHISMQHSTGLYHRMKNLSTPEDIAKWIMERKKRYPTKANIEHFKAEASEKRKRYEVIREKKSLIEVKKVKSETKKNTKRKNRRATFTFPVSTITAESQLYKGVRAFAGTLSLQESTSDVECSLIEDSDNEMETKSVQEYSDNGDKIEQRTSCVESNISLSLVADYGTDSDKDNEPEEVPFKRIKADEENLESTLEVSSQECQQNKSGPRLKNNNNSNNNRRNRQKHFDKKRQNDEESRDGRNAQGSQKYSNENRNMKGRTQRNNKIELLNKLLSRSIQHERNMISQCIKYIIDNKYFE